MCLEVNPDYIQEKKKNTKDWIAENWPFMQSSLETMVGFIPPGVFSITLTEMIDDGLTIPLAMRITNKKCLWLIRLNRADIEKLHEADLMGRFNPDGQNLDMVEIAAIYAVTPERFLNDPFGKKTRWKERLEEMLKTMMDEEKKGKLSKVKARSTLYKDVTPPYKGRKTLHSLNAVKAAENL